MGRSVPHRQVTAVSDGIYAHLHPINSWACRVKLSDARAVEPSTAPGPHRVKSKPPPAPEHGVDGLPVRAALAPPLGPGWFRRRLLWSPASVCSFLTCHRSGRTAHQSHLLFRHTGPHRVQPLRPHGPYNVMLCSLQ